MRCLRMAVAVGGWRPYVVAALLIAVAGLPALELVALGAMVGSLPAAIRAGLHSAAGGAADQQPVLRDAVGDCLGRPPDRLSLVGRGAAVRGALDLLADQPAQLRAPGAHDDRPDRRGAARRLLPGPGAGRGLGEGRA